MQLVNKRAKIIRPLKHWSPTFLVPGTGFLEDNFSTARWGVGGDGPGGNVSDGERQIKLRLRDRRSPPAMRPGS